MISSGFPAEAKVKEAEAKLELARHEQSAKRSKVDKTRNELQAKLESASAKLQEARGKDMVGITFKRALLDVCNVAFQTLVIIRIKRKRPDPLATILAGLD